MVAIPSDSFFLPGYIKHKIALNNVSDKEISYAISIGIKEAIKYRFSIVKNESNEWFYLAKILADTDKETAFTLASIYYIEGDISQAVYWYKQAATLKHNKALSELIELYMGEGQLLAAKALLLPLKHEEQTLIKLVDISVTLGEKKLLAELIPLIKEPNNSKQLDDIKKFNILDNNKLNVVNSYQAIECKNSVQLFATNLSHLHKLDHLINQIKQHPINGYFCFETPRYISVKKLNCDHDSNSAIQCDDTVWGSFEPEIETRYIGLMLNKGGANVDNGILYLDAFDDVNVFIHELSHFLGFVDEYALPYNHKVCNKPQDNQFSHNIAIIDPYYEGSKKYVLSLLEKQIPWFNLIDKETPLLEKIDTNKWKIGTNNLYALNNDITLGLYKAETCDRSEVQAFKPTKKNTNLRYYEEDFIPLYSMLLSTKPADYLMPSYHYNVAKSLFRNQQDSLGLKWLNKALNAELKEGQELNENERVRYKKIKIGTY